MEHKDRKTQKENFQKKVLKEEVVPVTSKPEASSSQEVRARLVSRLQSQGKKV